LWQSLYFEGNITNVLVVMFPPSQVQRLYHYDSFCRALFVGLYEEWLPWLAWDSSSDDGSVYASGLSSPIRWLGNGQKVLSIVQEGDLLHPWLLLFEQHLLSEAVPDQNVA
jgi:hypothetical protein